MRKDRWKVIGRGRAGWHAQNDSSSLSGAYADGDGDRLAQDAIDGALVYDASETDSGAFVRHVMSGPMVKTSLDPDAIDRFGSELRRAALRMAPALEGAFHTYAIAAQDPRCTALDHVGVGVFEALLRKLRGIRIGRVLAGKIVWED